MLLMRSLRDMNLNKLVADDIPLFNGLLADIFPKTTNPPKKNYPEIEKVFPEVMKEFNTIIETEAFNLKII
jgi:dynein heavy chain